jgi:hypothetical protein
MSYMEQEPRKSPLRRNELLYAVMNWLKDRPGQVVFYRDVAQGLRAAGVQAGDESVNACLARMHRDHDWGVSRVGAGAYRFDPAGGTREKHADVVPLNAPPPPPETEGTLFERAGTGRDGTIIVKGESGKLYRLEEL